MGVVHAIVANPTGDHPTGVIDCPIEVTAGGVVVALAATALIGLVSYGWPPGSVVVEVLALFAVQSLGVVGALTSAVDHIGELS